MKKATETEVATMFTRSARRDSSVKSGIMTREDVAVVCARDLIAQNFLSIVIEHNALENFIPKTLHCYQKFYLEEDVICIGSKLSG